MDTNPFFHEHAEERAAAGESQRSRESEGQLVPLHEMERRYIERVLAACGGSRRRAAQILGITRWSLARRLRKYGLASEDK